MVSLCRVILLWSDKGLKEERLGTIETWRDEWRKADVSQTGPQGGTKGGKRWKRADVGFASWSDYTEA